jgi:hypothetical protein
MNRIPRLIAATIFLLSFSFALVACNQAELPTQVPTAAMPPTAVPTATAARELPPTRDLNPTATPPPEPTPVPPTASVTPTATAVQPGVNITTPGEGAQFIMGSDIVVSGLMRLAEDQNLEVILVSANGYLLAQATAIVISDTDAWQASLFVPDSVSGPAQLQAIIRDQVDEVVAMDVLGVHLALDTTTSDRYLALFRPAPTDTIVAGYFIFFDGRAQRPVDNLVTISIWHENCRTQAARQNLVMSGSGYWWGRMVVPQELEGPACAIAHFGAPGEVGWREVQVPVTIVQPGSPAARGIVIGGPFPGGTVPAGELLTIYGVAYDARNSDLLITILLDNGRIVTEGVTRSDYWGFWELEIFLPDDALGPASITVSLGAPGQAGHVQAQSPIVIRPGE